MALLLTLITKKKGDVSSSLVPVQREEDEMIKSVVK